MERPVSLGCWTAWNADLYLSKIDGFHIACILDLASSFGLYLFHHVVFGSVAALEDFHPIFDEESPE